MAQKSASTKSHPVKGITTVSENHLFYSNPTENNVKPPILIVCKYVNSGLVDVKCVVPRVDAEISDQEEWFINCSRLDAEEILKKHREYGNVLIRPNTSFAVNGSYALSACTVSNGENKCVHYIISRWANGFKLEVLSKPAALPCLKDVLDYYLMAAGSQTHHAMVLDPTEASKLKTLCRNPTTTKKNNEYVNLPETSSGHRKSAPTDDGTYLTMTGNSHKLNAIPRRCSAPVACNKRDYMNVPRAAGAYPNPDEFYLNASLLEAKEPKGKNCPDYINVAVVANVIPGRSASRSPAVMKKASSFPVTGKDTDSEEEDDNYITPMDIKPSTFSHSIRPPRIHQPSGH